MTTRMLIDATHLEETRVVVVSGNRLDDFDYESSQKSQLKGNIYLAKVTRVEPSLQAAFVDYGGNRHGFLAFNEIHPDYYRIPISDREELIQQEAAEAKAEAKAEAEEIDSPDTAESDEDGASEPEPVETLDDEAADASESGETDDDEGTARADEAGDDGAGAKAGTDEPESDEPGGEPANENEAPRRSRGRGSRAARADRSVDTVGGDEIEDIGERRRRPQRRYRIQEVISRRQIILVQVAKEERGNKGAAITSYISLAGRYCVLMPNTPRGGGISRKISNMADRKRLKNILDEFDIPDGMAVIVRTAGARRTKAEIRRDYEYLLKLWDEIRERTLQSTAPALIHEEGNLIKRSIRDLYTKEIDEVLVEGDVGYRTAKNFMKLLIPSHAKRVKAYKEPKIPMFQRYQVEAQIDNIQSPSVQLKSGGTIVLNSTEALVAIDVNSGRATRERNIEETAVKTNLEAADEIARQLKLRDLAGLIVIDFIDMEDGRNRHAVERRLKSAMGSDRARIQIGRISAFGLLEMSRQRLRPSVIEISSNTCPTCGGSGLIRSTESTALTVLRAIEEEGTRQRAEEVTVSVPPQVAFYILNQKRAELTAVEERYDFRILVEADDTLVPPDHRIEKTVSRPGMADEEEAEAAEEANGRRRRRRGGRKRRGDEERTDEIEAEAQTGTGDTEDGKDAAEAAEARTEDGDEPKRRRRGRRGGRRRRSGEAADGAEADGAEAAGADADAGAEVETDVEAADAPDVDVPSTETEPGGAPPAGGAPAAPPPGPPKRKPPPPRRGAGRAPAAAAAPEAPPAAGAAGAEEGAGTTDPPAEAAAAAPEDAESAPAAGPDEAAAEEPPKPKRARRSRAKTAAAKSDPGPAEAPDSSPADGNSEAAEPAAPVAAGTNGSGANGSGADRSTGDADAAEAPESESGTEPGGPDGSPVRKRRGWWNVGG
ncbi:MAG: Rne/Rng family ribonuclease [Rhodospirillaceae bacterium]|nr:Rne/Rng family ribonuclease [Rhodospirillaceae bacterium]